MKKVLCIILIISILSALVFTANVFAEGETVEIDGITYTSYDTYCELTSCDHGKSGEVVIPSSVKFGGKSLPVTSIGDYAFYKCSGLTSVTIPDSVTSIGEWAFSGCSGLTSVTIPDSVTSIGEGAFYRCRGLTSVTIPDSVTSIGYAAFSGCSGLESINVSGKNKVYHSKGNCIIENDSKILIAGCKNSVIPDDGSVTSIGDGAFEGCSGLTSVTIGNGVTSIGYAAFCGCSGLTSVTIPDSVTSIGDYAFYYCSGLTSVTIGNGVMSIEYAAFNDCSSLETVYYKGSEDQWNKINIGEDNDYLLQAEKIFDFADPGVVIEINGGDCNSDGAIDNKDVVTLFRYVSSDNREEDETVYDFNGDNEVDNKDVVTLFRYISAL